MILCNRTLLIVDADALVMTSWLVPKLYSCHYSHFLTTNRKRETQIFEFNIPRGLNNKAQGCGTPLPWGRNRPQFPVTPTGLRHIGANALWANRRNSVGVEKREGKVSLTQGSGVPQPWAVIWNPVGILNTYVGILIPHPERKDVDNDKNCILECTFLRNCISLPTALHPSAGYRNLM